jgi:hypothetical protein
MISINNYLGKGGKRKGEEKRRREKREEEKRKGRYRYIDNMIKIFTNFRKNSPLKDPAKVPLEMDIWIPNLALCFEFQVC